MGGARDDKVCPIDFARQNIRVNCVFPGPIDTEMVRFRSPEEVAKRISKVPLKRMGTAAEVAAIVLFLLSDESAYVTGAEITVDGGVAI
jgi:3alpha(or 20beta)-hydroxysteroid dehydrogenase